MRMVATVALLATTLTSGCTSGLPGLRPLTYQQPGDTRIYASYLPCPHKAGPNFAPVLAAIALEVGSKLISGFGTALSNGAEGGALPASVATTNVEIGKDLPKCLVIIRGRFSPQTADDRASALPPTNAELRLHDIAGVPVNVGLPKVYGLQHYIEIQLLSSKNGTAMTFGPAIIYLARSMDGATKGDRALSIGVKFERPGHDPVGSALLVSNRQIGKLDAYDVDASSRMRYEAPWFAAITSAEGESNSNGSIGAGGVIDAVGAAPSLPGGSEALASPTETVVTKPAAPAAAAAPGKAVSKADAATANGPTPYTITATVIETRPTKEFLAFVAEVFSGVAPKLNEALRDRIDPATRMADAGASIDVQSAYVTGFAGAQAAMYAYCALDATSPKADLIGKSSAARVAQLAANKAAISADLTLPFGNLVQVSTIDPSTADSCSAYK